MTVKRDVFGIIIAALAIAFNVAMLAADIEHGSLYRMEYLLSVGTFLIAVVTLISCTGSSGVKYSKFFKLPIACIGLGLMILQMALSLVFLFAVKGHEGVAALISYPLLLIAVILMLVRYDPEAAAVKKALKERKNPFLQELAERLEEIAASAAEECGLADPKLAKAISGLAATARSTDQMEHDFLNEIDRLLIDQTMELDGYVLNGPKEKIQPMIKTILETLTRRGQKCRQLR